MLCASVLKRRALHGRYRLEPGGFRRRFAVVVVCGSSACDDAPARFVVDSLRCPAGGQLLRFGACSSPSPKSDYSDRFKLVQGCRTRPQGSPGRVYSSQNERVAQLRQPVRRRFVQSDINVRRRSNVAVSEEHGHFLQVGTSVEEH